MFCNNSRVSDATKISSAARYQTDDPRTISTSLYCYTYFIQVKPVMINYQVLMTESVLVSAGVTSLQNRADQLEDVLFVLLKFSVLEWFFFYVAPWQKKNKRLSEASTETGPVFCGDDGRNISRDPRNIRQNTGPNNPTWRLKYHISQFIVL